MRFITVRTATIPLVLVLAMALALTASMASPSAAATDRLPDLGMGRLDDDPIHVDTTSQPGRRLLRFSTIIVNIGDGPFEVLGRRTRATQTTMRTVEQRIYDDAGGSRLVSTTASMVFGGDGHDHWHVRDLEQFRLTNSRDSTVRVAFGAKFGYCFFDNYPYRLSLPGAPQSNVYRASDCGTTDSLSVDTGLSIGWGDEYTSTLRDQYIDITDLPDGRYRLRVTADFRRKFLETNETNNATWVDLDIAGTNVTVVRHGPTA
jgi:hypothetical protein